MLHTFLSRWESDRIALVCGQRTWTYGELGRWTERLSAAMADRDLNGKTVILRLENGPEILAAYLALWRVGGIAVPMLPRVPGPELRSIVKSTGSDLLLTHAHHLDRPQVREVHDLVTPVGVESLQVETHGGRSIESFEDEAPAAIFHTSGSTRGPKGVVYSRRNIREAFRPFETLELRRVLSVPSTYLSVASLSDTVGCFHAMWTFASGGRLIIFSGFDVDSYREALRRFRPTHSTLFVPHAVQLLSAGVQKRDFSSFHMFCIAGDKSPLDLLSGFREQAEIVPLTGYGLTESFVVALETTGARRRMGALGTPVPGVEVRIDGEGREAGPDESGEILVRSPQNALGYWRSTDDTEAAFGGGWLRTGDLGHRDSEGCLWFDGRRKTILICAGENISPGEIEGVLLQHAAVRIACVVGVPHPVFGEVPRAFVELGPEASVEAGELRNFVGERLVDFKVPDRVEVLSRFPLGRTGKVDREALRRGLRP